MQPKFDMVGAPPKPVQDTQNSYLSATTTSWKGTPQFPQLPMGPQKTPFVITGGGSGSGY